MPSSVVEQKGSRVTILRKKGCCGRGYYYDVVSLYPTVCALDYFPIGSGKYVNYDSIEEFKNAVLSDKFFGVAKVDITPPKDLYVPVLPDNTGSKLFSHYIH